MYIIKEQEIKLDFRSKLTERLDQSRFALSEIKDTFNLINADVNEELGVGSRVLVTENGIKLEGRVLMIKPNGILQISRDGYKSEKNFPLHVVKNLSLGTYGKLEKKIWLLNKEMNEIEYLLKDSEIPTIMVELKNNIIEVVELIKDYDFDKIVFVHALDLKSYKIKLPKALVTELGFYNVVFDDKDMIDIIRSSKLAFEQFYKR